MAFVESSKEKVDESLTFGKLNDRIAKLLARNYFPEVLESKFAIEKQNVNSM